MGSLSQPCWKRSGIGRSTRPRDIPWRSCTPSSSLLLRNTERIQESSGIGRNRMVAAGVLENSIRDRERRGGHADRHEHHVVTGYCYRTWYDLSENAKEIKGQAEPRFSARMKRSMTDGLSCAR